MPAAYTTLSGVLSRRYSDRRGLSPNAERHVNARTVPEIACLFVIRNALSSNHRPTGSIRSGLARASSSRPLMSRMLYDSRYRPALCAIQNVPVGSVMTPSGRHIADAAPIAGVEADLRALDGNLPTRESPSPGKTHRRARARFRYSRTDSTKYVRRVEPSHTRLDGHRRHRAQVFLAGSLGNKPWLRNVAVRQFPSTSPSCWANLPWIVSSRSSRSDDSSGSTSIDPPDAAARLRGRPSEMDSCRDSAARHEADSRCAAPPASGNTRGTQSAGAP